MREVSTEAELQDVIGKHPFVILDSFIPRCGPCATLAPLLEDISVITSGIVFVKANFMQPELQDFKTRYGICRYPTLLYIVHGEVKESTVGADIDTILSTAAKWYNVVYDLSGKKA